MEKTTKVEKRWLKQLQILVVLLILFLILTVFACMYGIRYVVDIWWFDALGYGLYYWQRALYRYAVFAVVTLFFFFIIYINFWLAARYLKSRPVPKDVPNPSRRKEFFTKVRTASLWFYALLSMVLSLPIALPLYRRWESFLFYIFGGKMGITDPYLNKDVSFYLFSFPIYTLIQHRLLLTVGILAAGLMLFYMFENRLFNKPLLAFERAARWHLNLMVLLLLATLAWGIMLQRYGLVYTNSHQKIFLGPGDVEMNIILPLIWASLVMLIASGIAVLGVLHRRKGLKLCAVVFALFAVVSAVRYSDSLPRLVETYMVTPNEIAKEGPYIRKHVQATLDAYKLTHVQVRDFNFQPLTPIKPSAQMDEVLRNIPVWDAASLDEVYQQLQELRTYYTFPLVSVGRYHVDGRQQQVFLSPREIEFSNLPGGARNWINEHLTYTHGFGAVMTPANQMSSDAMTWYLHAIPPKSDYGLPVRQQQIYYGLDAYNYSIAPNLAGEMDYPKGSDNVLTDYEGRGGVPVSSLFRKFLLAYYFKNKDIFFSTKVTDQSKLLFRRNIIERIKHLVPYLQLDTTPYVTVTSKGIYWIVDAYTTADTYPASAPRHLAGRTFNYIRNSVKIVVDAYNGTVNLYIYDKSDPIIAAYNRIYPGLFKSKEELPQELRPHIRYPKDYFDIQMQIYAKYHQKNDEVFYQQEDLWTFARDFKKESNIPRKPYYVSLDLFRPNHMDFMLLLPLFPKNRDNLRAVAIAGCDPGNYGKLIIYNFPKGQLVFGPAQINALINQDPEIAEQFTLWDQIGSQIVRGKMIILPVGRSVLFIQPVYLKSSSRVKIPELQRIIMSEGQVVVMGKSVRQAYNKLMKRVTQTAKLEQQEQMDLKAPSQHLSSAKIPRDGH